MSFKDPAAYDAHYEFLDGERKSGKGVVAEQMKTLKDKKKMAEIGVEQGIGFIPLRNQLSSDPRKVSRELYPRLELPMRYLSIEMAALRPSEIAHTTSDWPRRISPTAKTPGTDDM